MRQARRPESRRAGRPVSHRRFVGAAAFPATVATRVPAIGDHRGRPFRRRGGRARIRRSEEMALRKAVFAAALVCTATVALAQPTGRDCMAIQDKLDRLDCYDKLHGRPLDAVPAPQFERVPPRLGARLTERWDLYGRKSDLFRPTVYRPVYG